MSLGRAIDIYIGYNYREKHTRFLSGNPFKRSISELIYFIKTRTSYTLNSWIYTTNHKRISVNYFNFVLVAGTAGMSLATVIRSEFAYPGVGVLAGDSLQYLSIATAHGVIMVFYMIMPLIFGAFGNFLLPTQLGVHDVAFPRLNSAAFWFLPGGLIMLMQLVCVDRRYQRMNCFNIRELQGILKRRFFTDLVNSADHREILSSSMIGLRFKVNNNTNLDHDVLSFFKLGTNNTNKSRTTSYQNSYFSDMSSYLQNSKSFTSPQYLGFNNVIVLISSVLNLFLINPFFAITSIFSTLSFTRLLSAIQANLSFSILPEAVFSSNAIISPSTAKQQNYVFSSKNISATHIEASNYTEHANTSRFSRFSNPIVSYDYKCGNYIGI